MNLFQKIWNKNFKKGKEPLDKFAEDIGGLRGEFSWTKIVNGVPVENKSFKNTITNLSKSNVIRLLAQGANSPYKGTLNPSDFRLSKMRFGNSIYSSYNTTEEKELSYYDPLELSSRSNNTDIDLVTFPTLASNQLYKVAGGRWPSGYTAQTINKGVLPKDSGSEVSSSFTGIFSGASSFTISIPDSHKNQPTLKNLRPPSHKTLKVIIKDVSNNELSRVEFVSQYLRTSGGVSATVISGAAAGGAGYSAGALFVNSTLNDHKLIYDSTLKLWTVTISYPSGFSPALKALINSASVEYEVGKYNIIKSIVPKTSFNNGSFSTSDLNFYPITSSAISLSDSPSISFIDDYSATFSTTMNTSEGNGIQDSGDPTASLWPVVYTEAFLFNELDDLFSIIRFEQPSPFNSLTPPPGAAVGFAKDSTAAFLIQWSIRSLL